MVGFNADMPMQNKTVDEISDWIAAAREDPAAFGRLYDTFVQPIYRYVFSRVANAHAAEDVTSQTFMAAYESLPRYRERGQFSAWLFRIAQSKINDHFRRSRREVGLEAAGKLFEREDGLGALVHAEELKRIRLLIENLSAEEQELIRLRYVADLSFAEMAELLGRREEAVKKSLYRLLARLKGHME